MELFRQSTLWIGSLAGVLAGASTAYLGDLSGLAPWGVAALAAGVGACGALVGASSVHNRIAGALRKALRERDARIGILEQERDVLRAKPYNEDLKQRVDEALRSLPPQGPRVMRTVLMYGPAMAAETPDGLLTESEVSAALLAAEETGLVRMTIHKAVGSTSAYWEIRPEFKEPLEDLLYSRPV